MAFEKTKFGNGVAIGSGGNVNNLDGDPHARFGQSLLGEQLGVNHSDNAVTEITATITGVQLTRDVSTNDAFLTQLKIPVGAVITRVIVQVKTAFNLGGTTPTILIGTEGSEVTNGFPISEAQAEAVGTYDLTAVRTGTWNAPIATALTVGVALGGTTPTVTTAGKMDVIISYVKA
jgi:hypothetical protein